MTTGQNIADEVRIQLNDGDVSNYRWSDAELLLYINAAQRQIVTLLPEANIVEDNVVLATADSRQTLPSGGVKFIGAWNYDSALDTRGPAITVIEKDALDSVFPEWAYPSAQGSYLLNYPTIAAEFTNVHFAHVVHDPRDPKAYYLFPPPILASSPEIWLRYSKMPTALASLASTFGLGDEYVNAAVEYVTFRALMKDGRFSGDPQRRMELWNNFRMTLGLKPEVEKRVDPVGGRSGGDANG